ncbi:MAG: hypothetical protein EOM64_06675, partial [Erysipelotrichia bacterium]|nr:hypothetical protein [Erysipelotrichia bacterium]
VRDEYYQSGNLAAIAASHNITEIDIISTEGIITDSTSASFIGYDMASGEQSASFLVLNEGTSDFVQSYQPISYDKNISRKYAGTALKDGGFLQVGYDAQRFQKDIDIEVIGLTQNRHIGKTGYMIIADADGNIVSSSVSKEGSSLMSIGLRQDHLSTELTRFTTVISGVESYFMFAENEGYYIISVLPVREAVFSRNLSIYITFFMEIIVFVSLFILIYFLIKTLVVNNIRKVNCSLAEITGGNLNVVVDVRSNEEFASLSDDINSTVVTLKNYIAEAAARIDKELEFARSIQYSVLPSVFPPFPDHTEFDIYAAMATAKEVGGDFYDFYLIRDNTLAFLIADVSGKGIPAAMFMMTAKTMIKSYAESGMDVNEALTQANRKLCEENSAQMFVTCWFGYLDILTGKVTYCNAGHNPPVIRHKGNLCEYLKMKPGFVLAGIDSVIYQKSEFQLAPGDEIFLYTDGVTEAANMKNQLYGETRLLQIINKTLNTDSQKLCTAIKADVDGFVGGAPQFDDITMLSLKYKGVNDDDALDD